MELDFIERTKAFTLRLPRAAGLNPMDFVNEHGLDYSTAASTTDVAVLMTREPYAAAAFGTFATDRAAAQLRPILAQVEASRASDSQSHYDWPLDQDGLWPYQCADLDYGLNRKYWADCDEPGLGKTPTAIVWANELRAKKVLVACPANIRLQWAAKIQEWSTMPRYLNTGKHVIHVIGKGRHGVNTEANWNIVSYDLLSTPAIGAALAAQHWDAIILDEAHMLKTTDTHRTRAIFGGGRDRKFPPIIDNAERVMALTGTPLPNRPRECYALSRALCWDAIDFMSEDKFSERFNPSVLREVERADGTIVRYNDERSGRHSELQMRLRANYMARHLKKDVMAQRILPDYDLVYGETTAAVKQALQAESLLDIDPETLRGDDGKLDGHVATVRREMGIALAPQVANYVEMCLRGGEEKIVVFGWHTEVLDILSTKLHRYGLLRTDGSTSLTNRQHNVEQFQRDPRKRVMLGNHLSLGTGTDGLQHVCNHAVIAEPDWVPGTNVQCFDRLDRAGQRRQVQGDIFVARGSFAERVLAGALRKGRVINNALDRRVA